MKTINSNLRLSIKLKYPVFLLLLVFSSLKEATGQGFYIANAGIHAELIAKQHDFEIGLFFPDENQGFKYTAAYSPIKHLSLHAAVVSANNQISGSTLPRISGQLTSFAIGSYYTTQKMTKRTPSVLTTIVLNANLGYSYGQVERVLSYLRTDFIFQKIYTQVGIGYSQKIWGTGLFLSFNRVSYLDGEVALSQIDNNGLPSAINTIETNGNFNTFEYKLHLYIGGKFGKVILGSTMERGLNGKRSSFLNSSISTLGLVLNVDDVIRKITKRKK